MSSNGVQESAIATTADTATYRTAEDIAQHLLDARRGILNGGYNQAVMTSTYEDNPGRPNRFLVTLEVVY